VESFTNANPIFLKKHTKKFKIMSQETKKFAISEAIKLVCTQNIENKTKAVFDLADQIIEYIGVEPERKYEFPPFSPTTPIYCPPPIYAPTAVPSYPSAPFEVTCVVGKQSDIN